MDLGTSVAGQALGANRGGSIRNRSPFLALGLTLFSTATLGNSRHGQRGIGGTRDLSSPFRPDPCS